MSAADRGGSPEERLARVEQTVIACRKCPRLVQYREEVARTKRRAFREWTYWGRPVPGFGDARAKLLIVGLAPAAHGANRTGRMFTGDRSGDFLYAQLYAAGFANQPTSVRAGDGLELRDAFISGAARCAPPDNRPLPEELSNCAGYLEEEIAILQPRAVLALGAIAFHAYLRLLVRQGHLASRAKYRLLPWRRIPASRRAAPSFRQLSSQPAEYANRPLDAGHVRGGAAPHPARAQAEIKSAHRSGSIPSWPRK